MLQTAKKLHLIPASSERRGVRIIDRLHIDSDAERASLIAGLLATPAVTSPKYFYDAIGCTLFEAICALPEYYPTRSERSILIEHRDEIARVVGPNKQLVDLGAGDCAKAALLLPALNARRYVAVDIAAEAIEPALARMASEHPAVDMVGVVTDFSRSLDISGAIDGGPVTFFYPGSSIGNFTHSEAYDLLARIRWLCGPASGLLIGVDTKKDATRLVAAYDDKLGVTAAFNRNVLNHVNALAGCDFDPSAFAHVAIYNEPRGRIEMHLEARTAQRVRVGDTQREFARGERIHTENSHKYTPEEFESLLFRAGFSDIRQWQDAAGDFAVFYAR
jgi:dimethylhistidine N-methyltransferase